MFAHLFGPFPEDAFIPNGFLPSKKGDQFYLRVDRTLLPNSRIRSRVRVNWGPDQHPPKETHFLVDVCHDVNNDHADFHGDVRRRINVMIPDIWKPLWDSMETVPHARFNWDHVLGPISAVEAWRLVDGRGWTHNGIFLKHCGQVIRVFRRLGTVPSSDLVIMIDGEEQPSITRQRSKIDLKGTPWDGVNLSTVFKNETSKEVIRVLALLDMTFQDPRRPMNWEKAGVWRTSTQDVVAQGAEAGIKPATILARLNRKQEHKAALIQEAVGRAHRQERGCDEADPVSEE